MVFPAPKLNAYPKETVVAEKFEAIVKLGMANSRMKDFYDLWVLAQDSNLRVPPWLRPSEQLFQRGKLWFRWHCR